MNPDELVKGELYQVDLDAVAIASASAVWNNKIVLYLGSENSYISSAVNNYCFLVGGQQRLIDRHFLKNIKELK